MKNPITSFNYQAQRFSLSLILLTITTLTGFSESTYAAITDIIYVNANATGNNDGTTWNNAFTHLQDALLITETNQQSSQIWVANGIYTPTIDNNRDATFNIMDGLSLYGGFGGFETELSERNLADNITILSGEVGNPDKLDDNVRHILTISGMAIIDGFSIEKGFTTGASNNNQGSGIIIDASVDSATIVTIKNCLFSHLFAYAKGAAIFDNSGCVIHIENTIFSDNESYRGGAIYTEAGTLVLDNVTFQRNHGVYGGAVWCKEGSVTISNSNFTENIVEGDGGGVFLLDTELILEQTEMNHNQGGVIWFELTNTNKNITIDKSTFHNNKTGVIELSAYDNSYNLLLTNSQFYDNEGGTLSSNWSSETNPDSALINNCLFFRNVAAYFPGALNINEGLRFTLVNSTFYGNKSNYGSNSIASESDAAKIKNCIFWNDSNPIYTDNTFGLSVTNSIVQGGWTGLGNLDSDPQFVNVAENDFNLTQCSPAIDMGDNAGVSDFDFDGNTRVYNTTVDAGALEWIGEIYPVPSGTRLYVKKGVAGIPDGTSWNTAFPDFQTALQHLRCGHTVTEIWVASGTYLTTTSETRRVYFDMPENVAIYGGFNGTETILSERNLTESPTILSGDIGVPDSHADNSFHVLRAINLDENTIVDGFIISHGNADGIGIEVFGGGLYAEAIGSGNSCNPTIRNCHFLHNYALGDGGAAYIRGIEPEDNTTRFVNCTFESNQAANLGGAIKTSFAAPIFSFCSFSDNNAVKGGAVFNYEGEPIFTNTLFFNNVADIYGGAVYSDQYSKPYLYSCTLYNNTAFEKGGTIVSDYSSLEMRNSIVWGGTGDAVINLYYFGHYISNCILKEGVYAQQDVDPQFVNELQGDFRLAHCSPGIDAGNNAYNQESFDFYGNNRMTDVTIDIGAAEYQGDIYPIPTGTKLYINAAVSSGLQDGSSWANAAPDFDTALGNLRCDHNISEVWVAAGSYYPTTTGNRNVSFQFSDSLQFYGGFDGTESSIADRDIFNNPTILNGDIGTPGDPSDNTYHVITLFNVGSGLKLDGFTISGGQADGENIHEYGGGLLHIGASATSSSAPVFINCTFEENFAARKGAGIYHIAQSNGLADLSLQKCRFIRNVAGNLGGGIYVGVPNYENGSPTANISNCLFYANEGSGTGGLLNSRGVVDIVNSTFYDNRSSTGGEAISGFATTEVRNSIIWGARRYAVNGDHLSISNSIVQGGWPGLGNLDVDPKLVDVYAGDFRLSQCSPAIDLGSNTGITGTDLNGEPRITNSTVDMGAFEWQNQEFPIPSGTRLYVDASVATGSADGSSWANAMPDLQQALSQLRCANQIEEIWVAQGTYYPTHNESRRAAFTPASGIKIYGGFAGEETTLDERDVATNETILSGDIGLPGELTDNSYHILFAFPNNNSNTLIDGFTISEGNANGEGYDNKGAGYFIFSEGPENESTVLFRHCTFKNNKATQGGAIAIFAQDTSELLNSFLRCSFFNNEASSSGGVIYSYKNYFSWMHNFFYACEFFENRASNGGVGYHKDDWDNYYTSNHYNNSVFYRNRASAYGGVIYGNWLPRIYLNNCTLYDNTAGAYGHAFYITGQAILDINSTLVCGEEDYSYSTTFPNPGQGTHWDLAYADSQFVDAQNLDFHLRTCSPAVDAKTPNSIDSTIDFDGNPHGINTKGDLGAFEFTGESLGLPLIEAPGQSVGVSRSTSLNWVEGGFLATNGWLHFYDCDYGEEGGLLVSLHRDGPDFGTLYTTLTTTDQFGDQATDLSTADYMAGQDEEWLVMNRYWRLGGLDDTIQQFKIRFYFSDTDLADLETVTNQPVDISDLIVYQIKDGESPYVTPHSTEIAASNASYQELVHGDIATLSTWTDGVFEGHYYAEFLLENTGESYIGGSIGLKTNVPLPIELMDFSATKEQKKVRLKWRTASEENSDYFQIERAVDGQHFHPLQQVKTAGWSNEPIQYTTLDEWPVNGANYYRLKMVDLDGSFEYSKTVVVEFEGQEEAVRIFPVPTSSVLQVAFPENIEAQYVEVGIKDLNGRVLSVSQHQLSGNSTLELSVSELINGLYLLEIKCKDIQQTSLFLKQD